MTLKTDVITMNPNTNIVLAVGDSINVKFNVYNAGNERGQFHTALYIDGSLKDTKSGYLDPMAYDPAMECWYRLTMPSSGTRVVKFVGGYASGGKWVDDYVRQYTITSQLETGKFSIRVREAGTSALINGANVCLKADGASIGCKTTANGVTDWFANVGLAKWITGSITKTGFVDTTVLGFSVKQYNNQTLTYYMSKKEQLGAIHITSTPSGATAFVNGYSKGVTPITVSNLPDYTHAVYVTLTGYATPTHKNVKVIAGQTVNVSFTLTGGNGIGSAYLVTVHDLPPAREYKVKAYVVTLLRDKYWDPYKEYSVTSINNSCEILREDMGGILGDYKNEPHVIRLFNENGVQVWETPKPIRALKSTNDRLAVDLYANEGKEYKIIMSHIPNVPAINKAFSLEARLVKGQSQPVGSGQVIEFKEETRAGLYTEIGSRTTNEFGIAYYLHPGKPAEGSYKFIAAPDYGDATCDPHTVRVGEKESEIPGFLAPIFEWVQEVFGVDSDTAKTYTYIGLGALVLLVVGKMVIGGGGK